MKANATSPADIQLGTTPSDRVFHAFRRLQLVPTADLLRLRRALNRPWTSPCPAPQRASSTNYMGDCPGARTRARKRVKTIRTAG